MFKLDFFYIFPENIYFFLQFNADFYRSHFTVTLIY